MFDFDNFSENIKSFSLDNNLPLEIISHNVKNSYLPLCEDINHLFKQQQQGTSLIVGVNGAQGSGKSTLCELMKIILSENYCLSVAVISIDDLYKTHIERQQMANDIHPLFATRGVPGTHDVKLGVNLLESLQRNEGDNTILVPRFDKAKDDRRPKEQWPQLKGNVDIILFEGWCVGTKPQSEIELIKPINELESVHDQHLIWRKFVNHQLKSEYRSLFDMLDYLVFLKAPDYDCVFDWRLQQEQKLIDYLNLNNLSLSRTMNEEQLRLFIQYFERLTLHNQSVLPNCSDAILTLDKKRNSRLNIKPYHRRI